MNTSFLPPFNTSFDGIITSLNNFYPETWHRYVTITPSSTEPMSGRNEAQSLINRSITGNGINSNWCSKRDDEGSFILSFPRFFVVPSFYSFQSKTTDNDFPISWKVEGSLDTKYWEQIDLQEEVSVLLSNGKNFTFSLDSSGTYKHMRFTLIKGSYSYKYFCLRSVEIFGYTKFSIRTLPRISFAFLEKFTFVLFLSN